MAARAELHNGDAEAARSALAGVPESAAVLEILSGASYVLMEYRRAIDELERAYAGFRAAGDGPGAVRAARNLAGLYGMTQGDWAVMSGWLARARTLLDDSDASSERGWVSLTAGMFEPVRARKNALFSEAVEVGQRHDDFDLTFCALAYLGASLVHDDRVEAGMAMLDEALAAVSGREIEDFIVVEEIFCQLFSACERARDIARAEQWIRVGEAIAERRGLPAVRAYCHTHYGGILTAAGRWREADAALTEAVRLWTVGKKTLRGGAVARLAALRIRQGRYDEAAGLLEGEHSGEAAAPRAALHLARDEALLARELLEQELTTADPGSSSCLPLLALLVEAQVGTGVDATETVAAIAACAEAHPSAYAGAVVAHARASAGLGDARVSLREALDGYLRAQLPLEAARCRLELAAASRATPEVAIAEARLALREFERLEARAHGDVAASLLRELGEKVAPPRPSGDLLTKRELDVLRLLGDGLSNPEIAARLFISRKTVEHHVGNILVKLGLRNRAEAAAYVVRGEPAST